MGQDSIASVSPGQLIDILVPLYTSGAPINTIPGIMLWGEPGIGKSESVKNLAKKLWAITGKTGVVRDVRLLLYNPVDLKGIPIPDETKTKSIWLEPSVFDFDKGDDFLHILMLDEISAAPPSVQAAAYQLILDRKIGEHTLPDNVIIMAAGNRIQDGGVAFRMPSPLRNRLSHFLIEQDVADWLSHAESKDFHEFVRAFVRSRGKDGLLAFDAKREDYAFPTPRSWEFVSRYLYMYESVEKAYPIICGTIGSATAGEFLQFTKVFDDLPDFDAIISGKPVTLKSNSIDVVHALVTRIASALPKLKNQEIQHLFNFILDSGIVEEHQFLVYTDMWKFENARQVLPEIPRFPEFRARINKFL